MTSASRGQGDSPSTVSRRELLIGVGAAIILNNLPPPSLPVRTARVESPFPVPPTEAERLNKIHDVVSGIANLVLGPACINPVDINNAAFFNGRIPSSDAEQKRQFLDRGKRSVIIIPEGISQGGIVTYELLVKPSEDYADFFDGAIIFTVPLNFKNEVADYINIDIKVDLANADFSRTTKLGQPVEPHEVLDYLLRETAIFNQNFRNELFDQYEITDVLLPGERVFNVVLDETRVHLESNYQGEIFFEINTRMFA